MLQLVLKHLKTLTKNDEPFYLKNAQLKDFKFGVILHSFISHFYSAFFSSAFLYSLKLITNQASEFFVIFFIRESTKRDGLKTRCSLFD